MSRITKIQKMMSSVNEESVRESSVSDANSRKPSTFERCAALSGLQEKQNQWTVQDEPTHSNLAVRKPVRRTLFAEEATPKPTEQIRMQQSHERQEWLETRLEVLEEQLRCAQESGSRSSVKRKARRVLLYRNAIQAVKSGEEVDESQLPDPLCSPAPKPKTDNLATADHVPDTSHTSEPGCSSNAGDLVEESEVSRRKDRKENFCIECRKLVKEFCRHYERMHGNTEEGKKLKELSKIGDAITRRKLKMEITDRLRKRGNAELSKQMIGESFLEGSDAKVIPVRKSQKRASGYKNTVQCSHCDGYYMRRRFSYHLKTCKGKESARSSKALQEHSLPVMQKIEGASPELLQEVVHTMKASETLDVALRDPLIMRYASEFHKTRRMNFQRSYISRVITDLAKIFLRMQEMVGDDTIESLVDIFNPAHFSTLVDCILKVGGYNPESGNVQTCGLSNRLRSHIKGAAETAKKIAVEEEYAQGHSSARRKTLKHFLKLLSEKWANEVGRVFDMAVKKSRSEGEKKLAAEEDILKTCKHVSSQYRSTIKALMEAEHGSREKKKQYNHLMDLLITHIMCLIRRRPVDFKRGQLSHYSKIEVQDDLVSEVKNSSHMALSESDLKMCDKFKIFYVPGKGWKELVPIALTQIMKEGMDALVKSRKSVGIKSETLFVRAENLDINPRECLRKITKNLNLKKPLDLSGNGLRHHAATFSRLHSNHPQYQDYLASALGHSIHIHKLHYEMPTSITQKVIVCPILHKMTEEEERDSPVPSTSRPGPEEALPTSPQVEQKKPGDEEEWMTPVSSSSDSWSGGSVEDNKVVSRQRWTEGEKSLIYTTFGQRILDKKDISRKEIKEFYLKNENIFKPRGLKAVVTHIHNKLKRKQKLVTPEVKKYLKKNKWKVTDLN